MTISTTGNSQVFLGNGATTVFTFTFIGGDTDWLTVVYTDTAGAQTDVTASCTIALTAASAGSLWGVGGTVTYNPSGTPIASGTTLTITRTIPLTQLTAFANQNSVYNTVTEEAFDTELMQLQQLQTTLLTSLYSTSSTSLTIGTGSQSLTVGTYKGFAPGQFVTIAYTTTPADYMNGIVTSYTASSGALVVCVLTTSGSGTFATWYVAVNGPVGPAAALALTGDVTGSGTSSIATTLAKIQGTTVTGTTGSGKAVLDDTPTLSTPVLGIATATSINKVALTAPASAATLTIANNKTLTSSVTMTLQGGDASILSIAASKTLTASVTMTLQGGDASILSIAAGKTLTASKTLTLDGTDSTTMTFPASSANVAALNLTAQAFSGGARITAFSIGTVSSGTTTLDSGNGPLQYLTNNGAFTLAAPANDGSLVLYVLNAGSAGSITFSGFTVSSNTGDALTTTNTNKFKIYVDRINSISSYVIKALQ